MFIIALDLEAKRKVYICNSKGRVIKVWVIYRENYHAAV